MATIIDGNIRILANKDIDAIKWDACLQASPSGKIYSSYAYIDGLSQHWEGLIVGDYDAIMVLSYKSFLFFKLLCTPDFVPVLGLYNREGFDVQPFQKDIEAFIVSRYGVLILREEQEGFNTAKYRKRSPNLILPLYYPYTQLKASYSEDCRRNIAKSIRRGTSVVMNQIAIKEVLSYYKSAYGSVNKKRAEVYRRLEAVLIKLQSEGKAFTISVNDEKGKCVYAGCFLKDTKRLYYIIGAPNEEGRRLRATYRCIDWVVSQFAEQDMILDFEGSSIASVAKFYQGFGPEEEIYWMYYNNQLPFPLRGLLDLKWNKLV